MLYSYTYYVFNTYSLPGTVLKTLPILNHIIHITVLWSRQYYYPYFTDKKCDIERSSPPFQVTQLGSGRNRRQDQSVWLSFQSLHCVACAVISSACLWKDHLQGPLCCPCVNGGNPQRGNPSPHPNHAQVWIPCIHSIEVKLILSFIFKINLFI